MFGVGCSLFVERCPVLLVVGCFMIVDCWWLVVAASFGVVGWLMLVVGCLVVCCWLLLVCCWLVVDGRCVFFVGWCL